MKKITVILILIIIFIPTCYGFEQREIFEKFDFSNIERSTPKSADTYMQGIEYEDSLNFTDSLQKIISSAFNDGVGALRNVIMSSVRVFIVAALCSLGRGVYSGEKFDVLTIGGCAAILACSLGDVSSLGKIAHDTLTSINVYSKALLPVLTSASVAAGAVTAASFRHTAILFLSDVVITCIAKWMMPVCSVYIAIMSANAICGNDALSRMGACIKDMLTWTLRLVMTVYLTVLGLSGVISGSVDAVTVKTVKLTVSSAIPVVGGILADASDTILAGAIIAKNSIGVFGMLTILASALLPLIKLGFMYLGYRLVAALSNVCVKGSILDLIDSLGSAFGMMLGMTCCSTALMLISIFTAVAVGGT